ncbi:hypothetical protein FisN_8Hh166 [Fistulifera solaris]|uniref:Uncharacterized protein n=1 Tax=Fistulifera solaris TaxID=1519565 RepID=A0A1Z5JY42_FISSO|nr:hypothetical protein FisN_8Hh166 [Fistulifera solaris]|eukprot:GAX18947.1 hypothetical protein FisN_8Hh166 [Fistulifera solaris]
MAENDRELFSLSQETLEVPLYEPASNWASAMTIDLDIAKMSELMAKGTFDDFMEAKQVYEFGAFAWPYAEMQIDGGSPVEVKKGTPVTGYTMLNDPVRGYVLEHVKPRQGKFKIEYDIDSLSEQSAASQCSVGGNPNPNFRNCFTEKGAIRVDGIKEPLHYEYNKEVDNRNYRTIQRLSTLAGSKMKMCANCQYFHDFKKANDYFQLPSYADAWITAALTGTSVGIPEGGRGGADFSTFSFSSRAHAVEYAASYMAVAQFVLREMEEAFNMCQADCDNGTKCFETALHHVDTAVAFYTGSLVHTKGEDKGKLLYSLANRMCMKFKTCGKNGNSNYGTSIVNKQIFEEFHKSQQAALHDHCPTVRQAKESIAHKINVPLIQATLEAAYKRDSTLGKDTSQEEEAIGATLAATVEPLVAACNQADSQLIYDNLKTGADSTSFLDVKRALERNYKCMGVTCEMIGGLHNSRTGKPYPGAEACVTPSEMKEKLKTHLPWASITFVLLVGFSWWSYKKMKAKWNERKRRLKRIDEMNDLSDSDDEDEHMVFT